MNSEFKESLFRISLIITLLIHGTIILIFSLITFDDSEELNSKSVYLEFERYEKKEVNSKKRDISIPEPKHGNKTQHIAENLNTDLNKSSNPQTSTDEIDSLPTRIDTLKNYSELLDSIVIHDPSLLALKLALAEHIKSNPKIETDSALIVRRMKEYMLEYYKNKFPTPLSKFGDANPGIPIDDIIDLFSKKDTVDIKRIKKYLGIEAK